jgi:hypothetical protein
MKGCVHETPEGVTVIHIVVIIAGKRHWIGWFGLVWLEFVCFLYLIVSDVVIVISFASMDSFWLLVCCVSGARVEVSGISARPDVHTNEEIICKIGGKAKE